MEYRYLKTLNEKKKVYKADDLSTMQKTKPSFATKQLYREWCAKPDTDHVFYNTIEGDSPNERVSADNPPNAVWGAVGDYDATVDWDVVDKLIKAQCKDCMPTWRSKTQSGYIRLVWEFPRRVPVSPHMFQAFMKRISTALRMERVLAGFDPSSLRPNQYFELGEEWTKIGEPITEALLQTTLLKAAMDKPPESAETSIPIEVVAEGVRKKFPDFDDRWMGDFAVGERGPLFWIDDGVERDGCQIFEEGMICYSDRAGKGFVPWREILGRSFVDDYTTSKMGNLLDEYWYNGKNFFKLLQGRAVTIPQDQLYLELRNAGFAPRPKKGQRISEVEAARLTISNENRVDEIAPIIWSKDRVVEINSHRILNSQNVNPVEPADDGDPSKWPFVHAWLNQLFVNGKRPTVEYLHAWNKRFYTSVLERVGAQGQGLVLVGPTGRGKTLLSRVVIGSLVGGFGDASQYISGHTTFNKDLARVPCWCVDDTKSAASYQEQRKATEVIKEVVANPNISYMAKYCDDMNIPWTGRVILSLNMDANSLSVIPALDSSNRDKLIALRISDKADSKFPDNKTLESIIRQELPHYAKWLLDWDVPKEIKGKSRYGVVSYIDKNVASAAYDNSSRSSVAELVEFFAKRYRDIKDDADVWRGTLTEFQVAIHEMNGGRSVGMSNNLEFVRRGMLIIEESGKSKNSSIRPVKSLGSGGGKIWEIDISEKYDIDNANTADII